MRQSNLAAIILLIRVTYILCQKQSCIIMMESILGLNYAHLINGKKNHE